MIEITKDNADDFEVVVGALKKDFEWLVKQTEKYPLIVEFPKDNPRYQLVFSSRQELQDKINYIEKELKNVR
jgi:hypothetical protein